MGLATPEVAVDHWRFFSEFCRYEKAVGGPDPHMALVGHMSRDETWREKMWRAGLYVGAYNVPTAEALWSAWPYEHASRAGENELADWVRGSWEGLAFRRERRAVRTPVKFGRYLASYADWMVDIENRTWLDTGDFEEAWLDVQRVWGLGRYVALKALEFMRRYCDVPLEFRDIRAKGGWSPRRALTLLFPERGAALNGDDRPEHVNTAEWAAEQARDRLALEYGVELDFYELQVLLCDYKQSYVGRRQFPGRSQDSEIEYARKVEPYWGRSGMWSARSEIFPHVALGELQGWNRVREELGDVLTDFQYTWSDTIHDYLATVDLANPVLR